MSGAVWTIVLAGGSGARFGGRKQFLALGDTTVLDRSVAVASAVSNGVVVAVPHDALAALRSGPTHEAVTYVEGGATRAESTRRALAAVPCEAAIIVVHDGARPFADVALYERVVEAVRNGAQGAVPGLAVSDTVKRVSAGIVVATVPRDDLVAVQTPQAFNAAILRSAHADEHDDTDDAGLVEAIGGTVVVVEGDARNIKITHPIDVAVASALMEHP